MTVLLLINKIIDFTAYKDINKLTEKASMF